VNVVTVCNSSDYTPLRVLAHTLAKWGDPTLWVLTDKSIKSFDEIELKTVSIIGKDLLPEPVAWPVAGRLQFAWFKLAVWLLPDNDYLYLDTDIICMKPYDEIWSYEPIAICEDFSRRMRLPPVKTTGDRYNTGVFRFRPSRAIYDELIVLMREMEYQQATSLGTADQAIFSRWLESHEPTILPEKWNMFSKNRTHYKDKWDPDSAVFIHYAGGAKPWSRYIIPTDEPSNLWWDARREMEAQCESSTQRKPQART
jgi:lipopolysaccharide biosynthesis glycosyltransferase